MVDSTVIVKMINGAIDDFTKSIEIDPDFNIAYNNRGHSKIILGDLQGQLMISQKLLRFLR